MLSLQILLAVENETSKNKPGNAQVGAPLKVQKGQSVLNMRRDTFVKTVKSNSQSQKILKRNPWDSKLVFTLTQSSKTQFFEKIVKNYIF